MKQKRMVKDLNITTMEDIVLKLSWVRDVLE
jgi:hypothetical protein